MPTLVAVAVPPFVLVAVPTTPVVVAVPTTPVLVAVPTTAVDVAVPTTPVDVAVPTTPEAVVLTTVAGVVVLVTVVGTETPEEVVVFVIVDVVTDSVICVWYSYTSVGAESPISSLIFSKIFGLTTTRIVYRLMF